MQVCTISDSITPSAAFDYEAKRWGSSPVRPKPWYMNGLKLRYLLSDLSPVHGRVLQWTLTRENAQAVEQAVAEDGLRAVAEIVRVSREGRAPKNDPALFALALAASAADEVTLQPP